VAADVRDGKVSIAGALGDYGVVLDGDRIDEQGTAELRANLRPTTDRFFDRGPGYAKLSGGRTSAEVDEM
jgi:N-methylhydantoinase B